MSWKVFIIPRWQRSVLNSDRELNLNSGKLKFTDITGKPVIPDLTLDNGITSPRIATGADNDGNTYTLKIFVADPGVKPTPQFLGQLVKSNSAGTEEWYDTILALPSAEVLPDTVSDYEGNITLIAPKKSLIDTLVKGSITKTPKKQFTFKATGAGMVTVNLNFDSVYPSNFFCNDFKIGTEKHQLGGRYVSRLTSKDHVIFGHIHWDTDLYGPGDKTEPFLVVQPPPPLPCDDAGR
jgi:hypothetical protein